MISSEEQYLLKATNKETLKTRQSLVSVAKVAGGGIAKQETKTSSLSNPLLGSKDVISVNELFPHNLRNEIQTLVELLRQYYISENASDLSGISAIFNTLYEKRDVDAIDIQNAQVMSAWFKEFAKSFGSSRELKIDPRTFLKHAQKLYQEKGSQNGIKSFFRILFDVDSEVYLPWENVLIASDGKWDDTRRSRVSLDEYSSELKGFTLSKGNFTTNDGFLSDNIYLQDSFYYQQYSYDVKTTIPEQEWLTLFKILMHPAGFIVFSTLFSLFTSDTGKLPRIQDFGLPEEYAHLINILVKSESFMKKAHDIYITIFLLVRCFDYLEDSYARQVFTNMSSIEELPDVSIEELEAYKFNAGGLVLEHFENFDEILPIATAFQGYEELFDQTMNLIAPEVILFSLDNGDSPALNEVFSTSDGFLFSSVWKTWTTTYNKLIDFGLNDNYPES